MQSHEETLEGLTDRDRNSFLPGEKGPADITPSSALALLCALLALPTGIEHLDYRSNNLFNIKAAFFFFHLYTERALPQEQSSELWPQKASSRAGEGVSPCEPFQSRCEQPRSLPGSPDRAQTVLLSLTSPGPHPVLATAR